MANLQFTASIDAAQFNRTLKDIEDNIKGLNSGSSIFSKITEANDAIEAIDSVASAIVKVRGEMRQMEGEFANTLKSNAEANLLMADVLSMAAQSPFDLKDIADGAQKLISFGANAKTAMADLQMLGNVALGTATPINELSEMYGKLRENSTVTAGELSYLASKNIPVYEELARILQVDVGEINAFADAGKIGFADVQHAFERMTNTGGVFYGVLQTESESLAGLITGLKAALDGMFNGLAQQQSGILNVAVKGVTALVENYQSVSKILGFLIAIYGQYKAALIITSAFQAGTALNSLRINAMAWLSLAASIRSAGDAQAFYNLTTKANPYVLAATTLATLIALFIGYGDELSETEKAQERYTEAMENGRKEIASEIGQIELLTSQINNENISRDERNRKLQELIDISPDQLSALNQENIATAEGTKIIENYIAARRRQIEINALIKQYDDSVQRKSDAENNKNDIGWGEKLFNYLILPGPDGSELNRQDQKQLNEQIVKDEIELQEQLKKKIALKQQEGETVKKVARDSIQYYDEEIQRLRNKRQQNSTTRREAINFEKQIAALQKKRAAITGEGSGRAAAPFGSLEYWKDVSKKADDLLKKLNPFNKNDEPKIAALKEKKISADKKAEEVSKLVTPKTFEQTLEEKKKQYQDYYKQINELGKASADLEFEELLKTGNSYKDFLDKQIADLEAKIKNNKGTDEDKQHLKKLQSESVKAYQSELDNKKIQYELYAKWQKEYGKEAADEQFKDLKDAGEGFKNYLKQEIAVLEAKIKSKTATADEKDKLIILKAKIELDPAALDAFKAQVTKMLQDAQSETEKISRLNNEKDVVGSTVTDDKEKAAKLKELDEQINEAQKRRHEELVGFMSSLIGSEEEQLKIKKKYFDRRVELESQYTDKQSEAYLQQSELLKTNEEKELADNKAKTVVKSKEFEALTKKIKDTSNEETQIVLNAEREKLKILKDKGAEKSAEYDAQLKAVKEAEKKHVEESQKNWKAIADSVGALGNALKDAGGATGEIGGLLTGLSGEITNVQKTIQKAFSPEGFKPGLQDFASAVQNVISMISTIMESNRKRAEQERKFAQERVAYENQYALALNKNIGQGYKKEGNMFMDDIESKIKAGAKQYQDAQMKFQAAIGKLNEGKAKKGQKDVIDGQSAGKLIGQGASAGAIVGSIFGPLGTAIGAGVGAIVGGVASLFSKKKKDIYGGLLEQYPELVKTGADGWKTINADMAKALIANGQLDDNTKQLVQTALDYGDAMEQSAQQMREGILELTGKLGDSIRDSLVNAFKSGEDAANAFSKTVGNVIADMTAKLLFSALFKENFNQLEKEMMDSYGALGDQSIIDDLTRFNKNIEGKPEEYVKGLEAANQMFEEMGFTDAFGKGTNPNSLSGSIKSVSEETAGVLAGQMNAIRMTQATNLDVNRNQLLALTEIATNSRFLKHLERLETIEKKISNNNGDIRAGGGY
ncbi:tape measure protein [Emticicia sp. 21SJ11W-3]|uniref:tape measure protein n=1 Tax=Emticicia sp. 21SJ11W-3 TaxID=2916755 RepID=UPI0020A0FA67|nr:tape measure protein [Emticicia sp. 21SJ11W-3]UTA66579.1 tape measure protein [Emticicia sp. 21SJ11W-3]